MELKCILFYLFIYVCVSVNAVKDLCPKQCDCDMDNGLNRASCVDQNIISIDVGVPKAVQVYSLRHNVISELENYCFKEAHYSSIQVLDLSYNLIFWVGLHAFSGLERLFHLNLSNNRLRQIPSDLFWDTPELNTLDLSGNVFESLNNEPFIMHTKLQVLDLNNCRIKSLPPRLFTRLPNLRKLDLSENYMVSLNIDTLRPLRRLERIELHNEYWECNPDFIAVEMWIANRHITYEKTCKRKMPKMSEKIVAATVPVKEDVDVNNVWNITEIRNETLPKLQPTRHLTPLEKFDQEFSSSQAFIIGLELGLAVGIVGTYIWLRKFCKCGQLECARPQTRRQRRRQRADHDMRATLLWSTVLNPDLETPPSYRRQLSLPDRNPPLRAYGLPGAAVAGAGLQADAVRMPRSETPPPPYNECRINF